MAEFKVLKLLRRQQQATVASTASKHQLLSHQVNLHHYQQQLHQQQIPRAILMVQVITLTEALQEMVVNILRLPYNNTSPLPPPALVQIINIWTTHHHQLSSIAVVVVLIIILIIIIIVIVYLVVVITIITTIITIKQTPTVVEHQLMEFVQQLLSWTLNQHRKHIRPSISLMIAF